MSESKQKFIDRNRPPRVQIEYDVEDYGSARTIELPFVMGVMAPLAGESESREAKKSVADRDFIDVNAGQFSKFMANIEPRVKAEDIKRTLPVKDGEEGESLAVDLRFKSMSDFAPDRIARQVPELARLLEMRDKLQELMSYMDGRVDAQKLIAQLLNSDPLIADAANEAIRIAEEEADKRKALAGPGAASEDDANG